MRLLALLLLLPIFVHAQLPAQLKTVTGTVKDESGAPMQGVSVSVKGHSNGVMTDASGKFTLSVQTGAVLSFSYVNYDPARLTVEEKSDYTVTLKQKAGSMSDVVVVGYGTAKRKDLTGAVGSVNMRDFSKAPVKSFDDALQGRVAGVQVTSNDGQPGSNANIVIRGQGSITQDNSPLYVIDGFPLENANANSIDPDDIESIDVLKDAAATARYGARGSNGVILITTKKGKAGSTVVSYNVYFGIQKDPKKMKMMSPYQFVQYVQEVNPVYADSSYLANGVTLDDYKNRKAVDLQDYIYRTGLSETHDLAVRGGTDKTRYSISGNYYDQQGVIINSGFKRYQGRVTLDQTVSDKLKVGVNVNYAYSSSYGQQLTNNTISTNASGTNTYYASSNLLYSVWGYRPTVALGTSDSSTNLAGSLNDPALIGNAAQDYRVNPVINLKNQLTNIKNTSLIANAYAEYAFTPDLTLRVTGGITNVMLETDVFNNAQTQSASQYNSSIIGVNGSVAYVPNTTWMNENILTFDKHIHTDHHITVIGDVSEYGNTSGTRSLSGNNLPNPDLGLDGIDLASSGNLSVVSSTSRWTMASGVGILNYDYQSKYLFSASMRADASSKFSASNRWGYFPAASAGWRFSSEPFMQNVHFISDGKIRASYGASGNNRVGDFAYLPTIGFPSTTYWYSSDNGAPVVGSGITSPGNYNLKWETTLQSDIGLDLSLFKSRVTVTADVYRKVTHNLLLNASLPYIIGVNPATGYENVGELRNQGLEFSFTTRNIETRNFSWSTSFNISFNENKILSLANNQTAILSGSGTFFDTRFSSLSPYIAAAGRSVGEMYGLAFNGVYQYSDFNKMPNGTYLLKPNVPTNGATASTIQPGDIKYKDINGDGVANSSDYTVIGRGLPIHTGGFVNNFRYKNFDLNLLFQWSYGNQVINANRYIFEGGITTNPYLNQLASYADRWEPNNPSNTNFRTLGMTNAAYSSRVIEDGSYLKLRTISLGYNIPESAIKRAKIKSIRVFASGQNIFTLTKYSGPDPEASSRNSNLTPGFDYGAYPHSLVAVLGANINF
jgi:TonB-linked SusC/RagA family outer membrane protein